MYFKSLILALALAGPVAADVVPGSEQALNAFRAQNGQAALFVDKKLQKMAQMHADDMAKRGYFSHVSPNGKKLPDRAKKARYRFCSMAENIAEGYTSLDSVMKGWVKSQGHRANMLKSNVEGFGLAKSGKYWVMVLGRDGC